MVTDVAETLYASYWPVADGRASPRRSTVTSEVPCRRRLALRFFLDFGDGFLQPQRHPLADRSPIGLGKLQDFVPQFRRKSNADVCSCSHSCTYRHLYTSRATCIS